MGIDMLWPRTVLVFIGTGSACIGKPPTSVCLGRISATWLLSATSRLDLMGDDRRRCMWWVYQAEHVALRLVNSVIQLRFLVIQCKVISLP